MFYIFNTTYLNLKIGTEAIYINLIVGAKIKDEYYIDITEGLEELFTILNKYSNYKINIFIDNQDVKISTEKLLAVHSLFFDSEIKAYMEKKFHNKEFFSYKYSQDSTLKEIECISASFSPVIEMVITQCNKAKLVLNAIYFSIAEIFNLLIYLQKNGIITKNTNEANIFALFSRTNGLQIISTYKGFLYENSSFTINQNNSTEYLHGFLEYTLNSSKIKISKALDYPEGTANIVICAPRKLYQSLNTSKNFTNDPKIKIIDNIKLVRYSDLNKNKGLQIYADSVLLNFSTKLSKVFQEDIYKLQATTAKINFLSLISKILCLLILVFLILLFYKNHQFHNLTQQLQDENVNYLSDYSKKKKQLQQKYPQINTELYLTEKLIAKSLPHGEKVLSILDEYTNQNNVNIVKFGWENKSSDGMHNEINIHSTILLKHNYDKKQFIDNKSLHLHLESYYSTLTKEFNKLGYKCNFSINYDGIITTPDNIIITTKINLTYVNLQ